MRVWPMALIVLALLYLIVVGHGVLVWMFLVLGVLVLVGIYLFERQEEG